jgi:hypothetical protein
MIFYPEDKSLSGYTLSKFIVKFYKYFSNTLNSIQIAIPPKILTFDF